MPYGSFLRTRASRVSIRICASVAIGALMVSIGAAKDSKQPRLDERSKPVSETPAESVTFRVTWASVPHDFFAELQNTLGPDAMSSPDDWTFESLHLPKQDADTPVHLRVRRSSSAMVLCAPMERAGVLDLQQSIKGRSDAFIVQAPMVSTVAGLTARIMQGAKLPFTTGFVGENQPVVQHVDEGSALLLQYRENDADQLVIHLAIAVSNIDEVQRFSFQGDRAAPEEQEPLVIELPTVNRIEIEAVQAIGRDQALLIGGYFRERQDRATLLMIEPMPR